MGEALIESLDIEETTAVVEDEGEYEASGELAFPKLDGILFPLVVANAEVVAPCPWMGGAEVSLTVALNNYYQPMTEENADQVIADVQDFLAHKTPEPEEVKDEPSPEQLKEEPKEKLVVEAEVRKEPKRPEVQRDETTKTPKRPARETELPTQQVNDKAEAEKVNNPQVEEVRSQVVEAKPETTFVEPRETAAKKDDPEMTPLESQSTTQVVAKENLSRVQSLEPAIDEVYVAAEDSPTLDEHSNASEQTEASERIDEEPAIIEAPEEVSEATETIEESDVFTPLERTSEDRVVEIGEESEGIIELKQEVGIDDLSASDQELKISDDETASLQGEAQEDSSVSWDRAELEAIFNGEEVTVNSLAQSELAVTKANELLLTMAGPFDDETAETEGEITEVNLKTPSVSEDNALAHTELAIDAKAAHEAEVHKPAVYFNENMPPDGAADILERLKELEDIALHRGTGQTRSARMTKAGSIKTTLQCAVAIGRSALLPNVVDSIKWYRMA